MNKKIKKLLDRIKIDDYDIFKLLLFFTIRKNLKKIKKCETKSNNKIIWTMWWDGECEAPKIIKKCIGSIKKNAHYAKVIVIDKNNYNNYLKLPDYIMEKYNKNYISTTHLSDIIRCCLLAQYGGAWIDASVFVSNIIPENLFELEYYSLHENVNDYTFYSRWKWASFLQFAKPNNCITCYCKEMEFAYWKKFNHPLNYHLLDLIILSAYEKNKYVRNIIDNIDVNISSHKNAYLLTNVLNNEYSKEEYNKILNSALFFKLFRESDYNVFTSDGKLTYYGFLIKDID